jgi:S1-C subfamily serine protease
VVGTGRFQKIGYVKGDIIVAADGYRVRNPTDFNVVTGLSASPSITLLVWRDNRYVELKGAYDRTR